MPRKPVFPSLLTVARDTPDSIFSFKEAFPYPGVIVMLGDRGMGKTATAYWVMDQWVRRSKGKVGAAILSPPKQLRKLLPDGILPVSSLARIPQRSVCILDEAQQIAHARRSASAANLELANLVALSRQRSQLLILIAHHSRKLDMLDVMDASRLVWKRPSQGHVLFERQELKPFTWRAMQAFINLKANPRGHAYILDFQNLRFGMMKTGRPTWWQEEMSFGLAGSRPP